MGSRGKEAGLRQLASLCYRTRVNPALKSLTELLDLEPIEVNIFRGQNEPASRARLFGGQVAAQAFAAAGRTVEDRSAHSLHGYFLRPGDPAVPIVFTVDRIRDGSSFTTRRVVAVQHGEAIFNMSVSFHKLEKGYEHQFPMPEAPDPDDIPTWEERLEALRGCVSRLRETRRTVIELHYERGLSCRQIAERIGKGFEAVKKHLQRARADLLACIRERLAVVPEQVQ